MPSENKKVAIIAPTAFDKNAAMPDVVAQKSRNRGNENVTAKERTLARLRLLQQGSPEIKKSDDEYVVGAEEGMWHNSATGEVFESLYVMNLFFKIEYVIFDNNSIGADGFVGAFESLDEAEDFLASTDEEDVKRLKGRDPIIRESHEHFLMVIGDDGQPAGLVRLDCVKSRIKKSSLWNTQIDEKSRLKSGNQADRFASVWLITSRNESNSQGKWHNMKTEYAGHAPEYLYNFALNMYTSTFGDVVESEEKDVTE